MDASNPREEVAAPSDLFVEALRRRDLVAACAVYADDAHLLPPAARAVSGRDEIRAFWEAGVGSGISDLAFEPLAVRAGDSMSCEIGRYTLRIEPGDGMPVVERGHYVHIHERQPDGAWWRTVEIFTPGGEK